MNNKNIQELKQYNSLKEVTLKKEIDFNKVAVITKGTDGLVQIKNGKKLVIWDNKYDMQENDFEFFAGYLNHASSVYKYDVDTPTSMSYIFNLAMIERIELTNPESSTSSKLVVYYTDESLNESLDASQFDKLLEEWNEYSIISRI